MFFHCWLPSASDLSQETEAYNTENVSHSHSSCQQRFTSKNIQQSIVPAPSNLESEQDRSGKHGVSEELSKDMNFGSGNSSFDNEQPTKKEGDEVIESLAPVMLTRTNLPACQFAQLDKGLLNAEVLHNQFYLPFWAKANRQKGPALLESLEYLQSEYPVRYKSLQEMAPKRKPSNERLYVNAEKRRRRPLFSPSFLPDDLGTGKKNGSTKITLPFPT